MGCDIHLHAEIKVDGKWLHYSQVPLPRSYSLFEKMAGVRGDASNAIAPPRGMPDDASDMTALMCKYWGRDGHSHSWLNAIEIRQLSEWAAEKMPPYRKPSIYKGFDIEWESNVYFFGNAFSGWVKYPGGNEHVKKLGVTDVRFVFWFDN